MGQGSSAETESNAGGAREGGSASQGASAFAKTCYYEILVVARDATQDDIKKAYKKKALELHPDRNYNDVERATRLFTEVQGAYEVLSDPQERAWYDSHREAILRSDHHSGSADTPTRATNVTTPEDIMEWFSMFASQLSYDDSNPNGFYAVLGKAFSKLAQEEREAAKYEDEDAVDYPSFGSSKLGHEDWVKNFYTVWGNFRTVKNFSWCDVYRYPDAPDRRIKRVMEKENKRLRDAARMEFNDTVRSFVMFVRKRDPRFITSTVTEAQRQAALLAASKEQAARQRAKNAAKLQNYKAADWTQVSEKSMDALYDSEELEDEDRSDAGEEEEEGVKEEEVIERYECIVCRKTFGSEGQMNAHERSRKHTKAVQALKAQMRKENKEFDLDRDVRGWEKKREDEFMPIDDDEEEVLGDEEVAELEAGGNPTNKDPPPNTSISSPSLSPALSDNEEDDEYDTQQQFETRIMDNSPPSTPSATEDLAEPLSNTNLNSENEAPKLQAPKIGKAKARRAKKAAQPATTETDTICATCKQSFPTNTKMFNHLRDNPSHVMPVASTGGEKKGKAKAKGKRK